MVTIYTCLDIPKSIPSLYQQMLNLASFPPIRDIADIELTTETIAIKNNNNFMAANLSAMLWNDLNLNLSIYQ